MRLLLARFTELPKVASLRACLVDCDEQLVVLGGERMRGAACDILRATIAIRILLAVSIPANDEANVLINRWTTCIGANWVLLHDKLNHRFDIAHACLLAMLVIYLR